MTNFPEMPTFLKRSKTSIDSPLSNVPSTPQAPEKAPRKILASIGHGPKPVLGKPKATVVKLPIKSKSSKGKVLVKDGVPVETAGSKAFGKAMAEMTEVVRQATKAKTAKKHATVKAPQKANGGKKASKATKAPAPKKAAPKKANIKNELTARANSKQAQLIAMLERAKGASIHEIAATFGWQNHTVRGAIAGALKVKLGLNVQSEKSETRGTVYRII